MINTVAWFEIATDDPQSAEKFYGELFGWSFAAGEDLAKGGMDYRRIGYPGGDGPRGGLYAHGGAFPNHAVFSVVVADTAATCARVESLGGEVVFKAVGNEHGPDFAYVRDVSGNLFGVFTPPGAAAGA
ncbi:VOC family protein [Planomonospora sp. ID82291]|uniref:VOC family protein n=1 Tax=Planomonospora sp. ID82291 TaxID=2738136 RepID=UPI0018C3DD6C|nr:VOC family protein [Planomonospora sp. ID82291]MBG0812677.1 VOC family protein [Planomonospora sp. ID82291]